MKYNYSDGLKNEGELTHQEILSRMSAQPGGTHLVWQEGWPEWRPAHEVFSARTSIEPPDMYHYSDGTERLGVMSAMDIRARVAAHPGSTHLVWKEGWSGWRNAEEILPAEVAHPSPQFAQASSQTSNISDGNVTDSPAHTQTTDERIEPARNAAITSITSGNKKRKVLWIGLGAAAVVIILFVAIAGITSKGNSEDAASSSMNSVDPSSGDQAHSDGGDASSNQPESEVSSPGVVVRLHSEGETLTLAGTWWASSVLEDNVGKYGVVNVDDNDARTVWAEGESGSGKGERLEFTPNESDAGQIYGFRILNGHCRTQKLWEANARVRKLKVRSGRSECIVELIDTPDWQYVNLPDFIVEGAIRFEVLSVYPGSKYEDLTISEIAIIWEMQSVE